MADLFEVCLDRLLLVSNEFEPLFPRNIYHPRMCLKHTSVDAVDVGLRDNVSRSRNLLSSKTRCDHLIMKFKSPFVLNDTLTARGSMQERVDPKTVADGHVAFSDGRDQFL